MPRPRERISKKDYAEFRRLLALGREQYGIRALREIADQPRRQRRALDLYAERVGIQRRHNPADALGANPVRAIENACSRPEKPQRHAAVLSLLLNCTRACAFRKEYGFDHDRFYQEYERVCGPGTPLSAWPPVSRVTPPVAAWISPAGHERFVEEIVADLVGAGVLCPRDGAGAAKAIVRGLRRRADGQRTALVRWLRSAESVRMVRVREETQREMPEGVEIKVEVREMARPWGDGAPASGRAWLREDGARPATVAEFFDSVTREVMEPRALPTPLPSD